MTRETVAKVRDYKHNIDEHARVRASFFQLASSPARQGKRVFAPSRYGWRMGQASLHIFETSS